MSTLLSLKQFLQCQDDDMKSKILVNSSFWLMTWTLSFVMADELRRDPFQAPESMKYQQELGNGTPVGESIFRLNPSAPFPRLKLRGVVYLKDSETIKALIEVGPSNSSRIHMVKVGDKVNYDQSDPSLVFDVSNIDGQKVIINVGNYGKETTLIVR